MRIAGALALAGVTLALAHGWIGTVVPASWRVLFESVVFGAVFILLWEAALRAWHALDRATSKSRAMRRHDPGPD